MTQPTVPGTDTPALRLRSMQAAVDDALDALAAALERVQAGPESDHDEAMRHLAAIGAYAEGRLGAYHSKHL